MNGYDKVKWGESFEEVEKIYGSLKKTDDMYKNFGQETYIQRNPEKYIEERYFIFGNNELQSVNLIIHGSSEIINGIINRMENEFGRFNKEKIEPNVIFKKNNRGEVKKIRTEKIFSSQDMYNSISNELKIEMRIFFEDIFYYNDEPMFIPETLLIRYINPEWEIHIKESEKNFENIKKENIKSEVNNITL